MKPSEYVLSFAQEVYGESPSEHQLLVSTLVWLDQQHENDLAFQAEMLEGMRNHNEQLRSMLSRLLAHPGLQPDNHENEANA